MKKIMAAAVLVLAGYAVGRASQPAPSHVYELRTYTATEGKLDAVNARFRDHTRRIFERHNIKSVGYWTPSEGRSPARPSSTSSSMRAATRRPGTGPRSAPIPSGRR
jgi:hypothetical protein